MADLISDPEAVECLGRIRSQIRTLANNLRSLSAKFQEPKVLTGPVPASDLFEIWKEQWSSMPERPQIEWKSDLGNETVEVDAAGVASIFTELLSNAKSFGTGETLVASASIERGKVLFQLREPKREPVDPKAWGSSPLASTRRSGYGLGLWEAERAARANGAEIRREYLPADRVLTTTVAIPTV